MRRRFVVPEKLAAGLGVAALLLASCGCSEQPSEHDPSLASILLVTLDTTRRDHLGVYGYERATSPNLDRLSLESVVYTRAYSTSSWTLPAHASLFTGKLTAAHGARYDPEGPLRLTDGIAGRGAWSRIRARGLHQGDPTLARWLADAGYETGAVVAGPWMKRIFGLGAGFRDYDDDGIGELNGRRAAEVTDRAIVWLRQVTGPFFLFLNYYDPHAPYSPTADFAGAFSAEGHDANHDKQAVHRALYDAEILAVDHHLGRLLDYLRERALLDDMWVIVTADHGELFGEHGKSYHGKSLHEEEIRIPLVVKRPVGAQGGTRNASLVQLTDVPRILLEGLDLPLPPGLAVGSTGRAPLVVAELHPMQAGRPYVRTLIEGSTKLVAAGEKTKLFDLDADPGETRNLMPTHRESGLAMRERLDTYLAAIGRMAPAAELPAREIDESTRRALENLGYLE